MIAPLLWCLLAVPRLPGAVVIATPRGQTSVPITLERGGAAVAVPLLAQPLGLTVAIEGSRVAVTVGGAAFVFQLGAPFVRAGGTVYGLVGEPYTARDTVFLPLSWLADCVPRALGPRYRWDAGAARLEELPVAGPVAASPPPVAPPAAARSEPAGWRPTSCRMRRTRISNAWPTWKTTRSGSSRLRRPGSRVQSISSSRIFSSTSICANRRSWRSWCSSASPISTQVETTACSRLPLWCSRPRAGRRSSSRRASRPIPPTARSWPRAWASTRSPPPWRKGLRSTSRSSSASARRRRPRGGGGRRDPHRGRRPRVLGGGRRRVCVLQRHVERGAPGERGPQARAAGSGGGGEIGRASWRERG